MRAARPPKKSCRIFACSVTSPAGATCLWPPMSGSEDPRRRRIEGIAIEWPGKPRDLTVRYAVRTARSNLGSETPVDVGSFAGTRGRALALVGVLIELSGPAAANYEVAADAVFLGSQATSAHGQKVILSGPTGREPLVGLRLRIEQVAESDQPKTTPVRAAKAHSPGRVRVFRSSGANRG